jgi:N-acetylglucosaminyl-diphospho-decaprenol L-rhamnosyltransferase
VAHLLPFEGAVNPRLLVVILNYRTPSFTAECLASLEPEVSKLGDCHVVVVDGGSGDGSAEKLGALIQERYGGWAELLPLQHNGGFAYGNNAALRRWLYSAQPPRYYYLLNPDTCVRPGALSAILRFAELHPRAGLIGSRCENADGSARPSSFRFHSALGELESEAALGPLSRLLSPFAVAPQPASRPVRADWVSGAAMLIRRDLLETVGLLDEGYFLYYEETDFARRAAAAGFECWYVPESRVVHYCGKSTGITGEAAPYTRVPTYWYASRRRYFTKHHGRFYAAMADAAFLTGASIRRTRQALHTRSHHGRRSGSTGDPPRRYIDFVQYNIPRWVQS